MKVRELLTEWSSTTERWSGEVSYTLKIPAKDAARLEALAALYPAVDKQTLINQLLHAALEEIESTMPYVEGPKVVGRDEMGDPMFEDVGLTPKYLRLRASFAEKFSKAG